MIILKLPFPVSVNALYKNRLKGRAKSERYMTWANAAGWEIKRQKQIPINGYYDITIMLTRKDKRKYDIGNFEKCISDLLVEHLLIEDDSLATCVHIHKQSGPDNYCEVIVRSSNGIPEAA